jgi:uncharacterized protein (TIGR02217 family)
MSDLVFPDLIGCMFNRKRAPQFSNIIQKAVSGKITAVRLWEYPVRTYELAYDYLPAATPFDWQTLEGFYCQVGADFDNWLYSDPNDNSVVAQPLGTGTGSLATFQFVRTFGGFTEPIYHLNGAPAIYVNAVLQSSAYYTISSNGLLTFGSGHIPANGLTVTATFSYYFLCRFTNDSVDFNNIYENMFELQKLTFTTEKGNAGLPVIIDNDTGQAIVDSGF